MQVLSCDLSPQQKSRESLPPCGNGNGTCRCLLCLQSQSLLAAGFTGFHILALLSLRYPSLTLGAALRHLRHSTLALTPRHRLAYSWLPPPCEDTFKLAIGCQRPEIRLYGKGGGGRGKVTAPLLGSAFTLPAGNDNYATS